MGVKKVLIVYQENKDVLSHASKESMLNSLIDGMIDTGKTIFSFSVPNLWDRIVTFDDGSEIHVKPLSKVGRDDTYTHIYYDKSLVGLYNLHKFIIKIQNLLTVDSNYNTEGSRLNTYHIEDGELFIHKMQLQ